MKMHRKTWLRTIAALTMAAVVGGAAPAWSQEIKAKLGTSLPDSHPQTMGARKFAELVEQKSDGRIKIAVFSNGQLGSDQQMQAALRGGTQEFTVPSTATLANLDKSFGIIGMPFSFASEAQADAVLDGPFGQSLLDRLPAVGMVGLAFWENGFRNLTNSRRPVERVEDIRGLKVRTMQNTLYIDMFNGLGANAVPLAVTELFTALETRAVDGQENPYTVVHAQKFYDVQKYLSTTGHAYDALVLVASGKFWDRLSESDRQLLREVAREATLYQRQTSRELNAKLREELVGLGMQINDVAPEERERMREALQGVIDKHAAVSGADVTEQFRQALAASSQAGGAK
ncbi:TRAP transporter substrate-binding protein [Paracandidimonas soli]|uniref:Tripartite ATP-independent transporter DctP family solute receptor n=2 Tax=Paracandidimonas soli TaxID=1917182 RepID=A0A4R3VC88_9BURK|nr:tripartite ATP-independent transporter DctP family solute receptor [Paracandidimonas soli]